MRMKFTVALAAVFVMGLVVGTGTDRVVGTTPPRVCVQPTAPENPQVDGP